jgi:hypothetical protein
LLAVTLHSTPSDMQAPSDIPERVDLDALPRRGVTTQSPNQLGLLRLVLADNERFDRDTQAAPAGRRQREYDLLIDRRFAGLRSAASRRDDIRRSNTPHWRRRIPALDLNPGHQNLIASPHSLS